ncbi:319_t:CDS:1, partial [Dentiscutata heterogama]
MQYELALKIEKAYKNTNYNNRNNRIVKKSSMKFNDTLISQASTKSSNTLISQTSTKSSDTLISKNSMKKSNETLNNKTLMNSSNTAISKSSRETCNTVMIKTSRDSSYSLVRKALMLLDDSNDSNLPFDEIIVNENLNNNLRSQPDKPDKVIANENFNNEIIHESSKQPDKIISQSETCSIYDAKSIDESIDEITLMADSVSLSESSIYTVPEIANILEDFESHDVN